MGTTIRPSTEKADIYRKAAKLMEQGSHYYNEPVRYACHALELAEHGAEIASDSKFCSLMRNVFDPRREEGVAWLCAPELDVKGRTNVRILALCFMAAMVEAGDA